MGIYPHVAMFYTGYIIVSIKNKYSFTFLGILLGMFVQHSKIWMGIQQDMIWVCIKQGMIWVGIHYSTGYGLGLY